MQNVETIGFRRRHLPHWIVADRHYFVTIRLKGSLPVDVVMRLQGERELLKESNPTREQQNELQQTQIARIDAILDNARKGPKFLDIAEIGDMVFSAFEWLEKKKGWQISALTVMPNHVHVLMRSLTGESDLLNKHLGIVKGYTAREANLALNRKGAFWVDENFDHWCRTPEKVESAARYILENPVKAGLADKATNWRWTKLRDGVLTDSMSGIPA